MLDKKDEEWYIDRIDGGEREYKTYETHTSRHNHDSFWQ